MSASGFHFQGGFGATIKNAVEAYTGASGMTIVDPGGGGDPYFEFTSSWSTAKNFASNQQWGARDLRYWVFSFYYDGTLAASDDIEVFALAATGLTRTTLKEIDSTHFILNHRVGGEEDIDGTIELATSTWHTVMLEDDDSTGITRVLVWSGSGWVEHVACDRGARRPSGGGPGDYSDIGADKMRLKLAIVGDTTDRADAPDGNVAAAESHPNADGGHHTNYGIFPLCTGTPTFADVDDWASGAADGDTTAQCELGGSTGKQTFGFPSTTVPAGFFGVQQRGRARTNLTLKTVNIDFLLADGSNTLAIATSSLTSTSYGTRMAPFDRQSDGSSEWDQSGWNANECGVGSPSSNGANDIWTAHCGELFGVGNQAPPDPAAVGETRRKLLHVV